MYKVLDLFSGIGGFSLGLERTGGFTTSAFCEICPEARKVLRKHWADVPIYEDITKLTAEILDNDGLKIDCITGGFPCQDISGAGYGDGIVGKRSGLWRDMCRLVWNVRPKWVIAENVSALRSKGLTLVLQNLSTIGYDAEWHCIPASAIGAPHQRDRIWIIAKLSNALLQHSPKRGQRTTTEGEGASGSIDEARGYRDAKRKRPIRGARLNTRSGKLATNGGYWKDEPEPCRVAHGIPRRVDRLKQLGNSVVPQIPELIGNSILKKEGKHECFTGQEL